ncbi:CPBP family intramembrane glutamic endopeptidase [Micrococcoides hystricis]|uniref:Lysostaphin resistance A-like protein n=1 Tax=Micrococcoides hystricis TaxID=1572761 RepID=A0ABV6PBN6_9MICC
MNMYYPPSVRTRTAPDLKDANIGPGRFWWMDTVTLIAYPVLMVGGMFALAPVILRLSDAGVGLEALTFGANAVVYLVLVILVLIAAGKDLKRSMPGKGRFSPVHLLWIPVAWLGSIAISIGLAAAAGGVQQSLNQESIQQMTTAAPFWLMFIVVVLMGPLVEEYIFRHLLIGKVSRRFKIEWLMVAISALAFASIHFISGGDLSFQALVPYLGQGIAIGIFYVLMRKSLFMAWLLHALNNFVALILLYATQGMGLDTEVSVAWLGWAGVLLSL